MAPLTQLTSIRRPFSWNPTAKKAFVTLKRKFTAAPVLAQPDPTRQFIVEVDASDSGVGAVLSQVFDNKKHPCAFFSRRLSPAEQNYDIGYRELLTVKLALEEWRHLLEGAEHPCLDRKQEPGLHSVQQTFERPTGLLVPLLREVQIHCHLPFR